MRELSDQIEIGGIGATLIREFVTGEIGAFLLSREPRQSSTREAEPRIASGNRGHSLEQSRSIEQGLAE
jgi:hypothetical protein